jgi:basic membrane protein A
MLKRLLIASAFALASFSTFADEPVKVGFVYVGPIGDHGWTYRHDIGRQQVEEHFGDQVETMYLESVSEGPDTERAVRMMIQEGADIIFTTSFGFMDPTLRVAKENPDVYFEHATGFKRHDNMSTYGLRLISSSSRAGCYCRTNDKD